MQLWEQHLARWVSAGVVDAGTAERIRSLEVAQEKSAGARWQVVIALVLGAISLSVGVLLFVVVQLDQLSPMVRLALVVAMLAVLHLGAIAAAPRFPGTATALHGLGTVAAGVVVGIMQQHWPAGVLLWALCAAAGWWWLRDEFQQICLMLLVPAWLICEWTYRASTYSGEEVYLVRMIAVLAAVYLTAFVHSRRLVVFGVLFGLAAIALVACTRILSGGGRTPWPTELTLPLSLRIGAILLMVLMLAAGWVWERQSLWPSAVVMAAVFALPWLQVRVGIELPPLQPGYERFDDMYSHWEPSVWAYALVAAVAIMVAWWGVRERSRAVVSYGVAMFSVTVAWFYFSSLIDRLGRGRSLGLIGLGMVFLLGGWLLERGRLRRMLQKRPEATA